MAKETDTTMREQTDAVALVSKIMSDANALSAKMQGQLVEARRVLELLREFQHPKMVIDTSYEKFSRDRKSMNPIEIIDAEISRINAVLGDRA